MNSSVQRQAKTFTKHSELFILKPDIDYFTQQKLLTIEYISIIMLLRIQRQR